jgi:hypothetical protein
MTNEDFWLLVGSAHRNAVAHGWWNDCKGPDGALLAERVQASIPEKVALIHSELSEALGEYRNDPKNLTAVNFDGAKPTGFMTELADVVIRVADLLGALKHAQWDIASFVNPYAWGGGCDPVPTRLAALHRIASEAYAYRGDAVGGISLVWLVSATKTLAEDVGGDLKRVIQIKHAYNMTRPFRHGGKAC